MNIELIAKVVVVVSFFLIVFSLIKFVSGFSAQDKERWEVLGKPYFFFGNGMNVYMKEALRYYKVGSVDSLKTYSRVYRFCSLLALVAGIVGILGQNHGV